MRVLMITSEWPTVKHPEWAPFIVQQVKYLCKAGVDVEVFSFRGNKNPINYLKAWLKVRKVCNNNCFDLVHTQFGQSGLLTLFLRPPMVATFWGSDLHGIVGSNGRYTIRGALLRHISRYVARRAKKVIVVSKHLIKYLPPELSVHVVPGGLDLERFYPIPQKEARNRLGLPQDKQLVLFAANPNTPVKRYYLAQKVVELIKDKYDAELITIYNVPHRLVPVYMNACDVLVLTSKHEGAPNVVKEALACNLPIVSVDVGDVRQSIGSIKGCVLCQGDSAEVIAAGLTEVLQNNTRICGQNSVANLDIWTTTQKLIDIYRSVTTAKN